MLPTLGGSELSLVNLEAKSHVSPRSVLAPSPCDKRHPCREERRSDPSSPSHFLAQKNLCRDWGSSRLSPFSGPDPGTLTIQFAVSNTTNLRSVYLSRSPAIVLCCLSEVRPEAGRTRSILQSHKLCIAPYHS